MLKNSKRIESILKLVPSSNDVLWDLCCDHGNIGLSASKHHQQMNIKFVDQVQSIIDKLNNRLVEIKDNRLSTICESATLVNYNNDLKNTFLIAGVGGDLTIKILKQILSTNNTVKNTFIISPHNNISNVREYLVSSGLKLETEILVEDNNQFYEMIVLNNSSAKVPTKFGHEIWKTMDEDHQLYIKNELKHLEKKLEYSKEKSFLDKYEFFKNLLKH